MAKKVIYLVGAIELANNYGKTWRAYITPKLERLGFEVLNPCLLENEQLKNIKTKLKLPLKIKDDNDKLIPVKDWHDLYLAPEGSKWRKLFKECMLAVMDYDTDIVLNRCDCILCYWDEACDKSAGSHGELTLAYCRKIPVVIVHTSPFPLSRWGYCCAQYGTVVKSFKEALRWLKTCL